MEGQDEQLTAAPASEGVRADIYDEDGVIRSSFLTQIGAAIADRDTLSLKRDVGDLHQSELGDLLEALVPEQRRALVELLGQDFDFSVLTEDDEAIRLDIVENLPNDQIAQAVQELDSDDAVYILEDLPKEEQAEILEQLPQLERAEISRSLDYPEGSAGRRMQTEFIAAPPTWTVGQTIDYMRETADLPERFYEIYVIDPAGRYQGAVPLDRLLRSTRPVPIESLLERERRCVRATDDQEEVARTFERYDLVAIEAERSGVRAVAADGQLGLHHRRSGIEGEIQRDLGHQPVGRRIIFATNGGGGGGAGLLEPLDGGFDAAEGLVETLIVHDDKTHSRWARGDKPPSGASGAVDDRSGAGQRTRDRAGIAGPPSSEGRKTVRPSPAFPGRGLA